MKSLRAFAVEVPVYVGTGHIGAARHRGPTDNADTVAPATVRYAIQKVARTAVGITGSEAGSAARLHVSGGAAAGRGQGFRELGGQGAVLTARDCGRGGAGGQGPQEGLALAGGQASRPLSTMMAEATGRKGTS